MWFELIERGWICVSNTKNVQIGFKTIVKIVKIVVFDQKLRFLPNFENTKTAIRPIVTRFKEVGVGFIHW